MHTSKQINSSANRLSAKNAGFTVVELLVVLGIIALLAAVIAPRVIQYLAKAKIDTATAQLKNVEGALELYYLDMSTYPTTSMGLISLLKNNGNSDRWNGPYLKNKKGIIDPWGNIYRYRSPGKNGGFDLYSFGRDNLEGGDGENQDILNW